ncbi:hypothetical protein BJ912DRAFT_665358 [Pholiota molesta]|nr:hypothetical protein BJ912DRAFT_665358 [Pholiota molesta]
MIWDSSDCCKILRKSQIQAEISLYKAAQQSSSCLFLKSTIRSLSQMPPKAKAKVQPPSASDSITAALKDISLSEDLTDANIRFLPIKDDFDDLPPHARPGTSAESASCIGEIPERGAMRLTRTIDQVSKMLEKELEEYPNVISLVDMKENLEGIRIELEELKQHRAFKRDAKAMLLSFSSLTWRKLQTRFGVKAPLLKQIDREKMKLIVERAQKIYRQSFNKVLYDPEAWDHAAISDQLEFAQNLVLQRKEASARMNIDKWVLELGRYLQEEEGWVVIIPEFTIQVARDGKAIPSRLAEIEYNNLTTALTGVADYAVIAQGKYDWVRKDFERFKSRALAVPSLSYNHLAANLAGVNIVVVEAKDILTVKLEAHLPQVVGQCIAILNSAAHGGDAKRQAVPFYLTNGNGWIFGVVAKFSSVNATSSSSTSPNATPLYESFIFPKLDIIPVKPGTQVETRFNKYETFLKTLLAWAKLRPDQLVQAIVEELGPQRA